MRFDRRMDRSAIPMTDHRDQLQASGCRGVAFGANLSRA